MFKKNTLTNQSNSYDHWRCSCWQNKFFNQVIEENFGLLNNNFSRYTRGVMNRAEKPTVGVEFATKNIVLKDGTITKAKLWDTGKNKTN